MNPASAAAGPKTAARWQFWTASRTRNAVRSRRWRSAAAAGRTPLPSASPLHPHGCEVSLEYSPVLGYPNPPAAARYGHHRHVPRRAQPAHRCGPARGGRQAARRRRPRRSRRHHPRFATPHSPPAITVACPVLRLPGMTGNVSAVSRRAAPGFSAAWILPSHPDHRDVIAARWPSGGPAEGRRSLRASTRRPGYDSGQYW